MTEQLSKLDIFDDDELLALARIDIDRKDYTEALWKLKTIFISDESPTEAFSIAARLYAHLGMFKQSTEFFRKFLENNPDAELEKFQLGMSLFDNGETKQALKIWEEVLNQNPNHPPALFYKNLALSKEGNLTEAMKGLEEMIKIIPSDNLYFNHAKELLQEISQGQTSGNITVPNDAYKTLQ